MERRSLLPPAGGVPEVATLVRGLSRAIRALGYYEAGHPVIEQTLTDAVEVVRRLVASGGALTLAGAGASIIHDAGAPALTDEPARIVADALFQRSVIAVRFERALPVAELASALLPLADAPDRVRAAGGVARAVAAARASGVVVVEIDFRAVFAGDRGSLPPELTADPVISRALREVLRYEEEGGRAGEAVSVDFEALSDAGSLGSFLDDLVDAAEPAARHPRDPGRKQAAAGDSLIRRGRARRDPSVSVDEVADLAAEAYLHQQVAVERRGAPEGELLQGAQVLADALVRLSPEARFALLRRLAGGESGGAREEAAVARVGAQLDSGMVVDAVAAAISAEGADAEVVQAVGNLVRRLFPVEAERRRLLGALDREQRARGQPLGGALWQELNARALGREGLGMLELDVTRPRRKLVAHANARRTGRLPHVEGQEILGAVGAAALEPALATVLGEALRDKRELSTAVISGASALIARLEDAGHRSEADALLDALLERADHSASEVLGRGIQDLLAGARGGERIVRLVSAPGGGSSKLRGELLLRAMEEAPDRAFREELLQRLARFDARTVEKIAEGAVDAPPARVANLMHVAVRMDGRTAVAVARTALKSGSARVKEIVLKALIERPQAATVALLGMAAGAKGDDAARHVLALSGEAQERRLPELQAVAISALGLCRAPDAVPQLVPLITRQSLLPSRTVEEQRVEAARALAVNGSGDAIKVLRAGAEHKKKNVREACERALKGRSG